MAGIVSMQVRLTPSSTIDTLFWANDDGTFSPIQHWSPDQLAELTGGLADIVTALQTAPVGGYTLLTNATARGASIPNIVKDTYIWEVAGTFGGAVVTLQCLSADGSWVDVWNFTAPGVMGVQVGSNSTVRAEVVGGSPSGLYSKLS